MDGRAVRGAAVLGRCRAVDPPHCSSYYRTMLWQVDPRDPQPLYEQIAGTVRRAIGEGTLSAGDRLPAAKELAASLDVNLHTVLRAYQMLRDEGLIELRRGRGAIVIASDLQMSKLTTLADDLVAQAQRLGVSRDELARIILEGEADE